MRTILQLAGALGVSALALMWAPSAGAADFSMFLRCAGKINNSSGGSTPAHVDLALRDNNTTALIQKSNVIPVGERLKYAESPMAFSMTWSVPVARTAVLYDWWRGAMFVWMPSLKRLSTIRMSIDRGSGELSGDLLNHEAQSLATLAMKCESIDPDELEQKRKF
jgi:hypothetical protein